MASMSQQLMTIMHELRRSLGAASFKPPLAIELRAVLTIRNHCCHCVGGLNVHHCIFGPESGLVGNMQALAKIFLSVA